jgi:enoyl-CoA hydratase/carnithine racemase
MAHVDVDNIDGCGVVTLNNPKALNAWSQAMQRRVADLVETLDDDPDVKGIVLTGAGDRAFCAGQDLNELSEFTTSNVEDWLDSFYRVYNTILATSKPVVAALNGVTAGSGYQLSLVCDLRIAHPGVKIGQPEVRSGIPSVTGMYLTWQSLGHSKTTELMLTGRMMDADEAHRLGLIAEICPKEDVLSRSVAVVGGRG